MKHDNLPPVLPLYILEQPLLLPGTVVPFAVTDPGERSLVDDALETDRYVAIVQPLEAEAPAARGQQEGRPAIYSVGCVAYIGECHETEQDRYLVLAGGVIRFRIVGEAACDRGYRRVMVDYEDFRDDLDEAELELEFPLLRDLVRQRIEANEADIDLSIMEKMAGTEIVTAIAHAIALSAAERQVLMETPSLRELEEVLLQLMIGPGGLPSFDLQLSWPS
ncbi:MAG TPA: LON peptidase substrate-binding domain-containing protein [Thermoanaerobaculia bacterium]|nr:LON peptidase substrate-binding domain-containing protein [Thermoanaerobaculia bacterium]